MIHATLDEVERVNVNIHGSANKLPKLRNITARRISLEWYFLIRLYNFLKSHCGWPPKR